ncbi:hypothetical protein [Cupriavidus sp. TMH.W2]|uniref:hypothetical protein n=1 Tax=Cupriavidus sp. TMH.W2 TaxID=3434465 RepID=UPI003D76D1DC
MKNPDSKIFVSNEPAHRYITIPRATNDTSTMAVAGAQNDVLPPVNTRDLTPDYLEALLLRHGNSLADSEDQASPFALLLELLDYAAWDAGLDRDASLTERCTALAAFGRDWSNQFGCTVSEHADGSKRVLWGYGDVYTWCSLGDVLEAVENGNRSPRWYDREWIMVEVNGRWVHKGSLERR